MHALNTDVVLEIRENAQRALEMTLAALRATGEDKQRIGGMCCIGLSLEKHGQPSVGQYIEFLSFGAGRINLTDFPGYVRNAHEKALRLGEHYKHVSSWQTRDFEAQKYGGAIACRLPVKLFGVAGSPEDETTRGIISFSGLPEIGDEMFCLKLAQLQNWAANAQDISEISDNVRLATAVLRP